MNDSSCADCGVAIDVVADTHYRVGEEERPPSQLTKEEKDLTSDDFFSNSWLVCPSCMSTVIGDIEPRGDQQDE